MALSRQNTFTDDVDTAKGSEVAEDFDNIYNNMPNPDNLDDASADNGAMQATRDPYPGASESLATTLREELQSLRYLLKQITGESQWYVDPATDLSSIIGGLMSLKSISAQDTLDSTDGIVLCDANGGAFTITLPAVASVSVGKAYAIKKIDTTTNIVTVDGSGSELLDGFVSRFLRHQNDYIWLYNTGTGYAILGQSKPKRILEYKNLVVRNNPDDPGVNDVKQIDIDADVLDLEDAAVNLCRMESINLTVDITASGANGLDTGSEAGNTTYAVWVIYNFTTDTIASLLSTSFTIGGLTFPTGYTYARLVGFVRNDAGNNFIPFIQNDNRLLYDNPTDDTEALTDGSSLSWADVDITTWAGDSVISKTAILSWHLDYEAAGDATTYARIRPNGGVAGNGKTLATIRKNTGSAYYGMYTSGESLIHLDSSLIFEYIVADAANDLDIYVAGLILNL